MSNKKMRVLGGLTALVSTFMLSSERTTAQDAIHAAQANGWDQVHILEEYSDFFLGGYRSCDGQENSAYVIAGENPRGDLSRAVVCCGYFKNFGKGCTIRYDTR